MTKAEAELHQQALALINNSQPLTDDQIEFVLTHWQESTVAAGNVVAGAYRTPPEYALDLRHHVYGERVLDLCAGIGCLAWAARDPWGAAWAGDKPREVVCVESNPAYVEIGKRVLPEATWICADVFDLPPGLGKFDTVISNPPFGATRRTGNGPRYTGRTFEYHLIDIAADYGRHGVFIVPQASAPFRYSGERIHRWLDPASPHMAEYEQFRRQTGIVLDFGIGVDTSVWDEDWHGVKPRTEIVCCDFTKRTATVPPVEATPVAAPPGPTRHVIPARAPKTPAAPPVTVAPAEEYERLSL